MAIKYKPDYFMKDFNTIREELIARVPIISEGKLTDLNESSVTVTLIETFAAIFDMLAFYLDSSALEAFLPTVRQPENVYRLVDLIGYRVREVTSAQVSVKFSLDAALSEEVYFPVGTIIGTTGGGGVGLDGQFITTERTTIPIGDTESEAVSAVQGVAYTESFTGDGTASQVAILGRDDIDIDSIKVTSGNVQWEQQDTLLYSEVLDNHYVVKTTYLGENKILFGDGKYGRVPAVGETITVQYIQSAGEDGNVGAGAISVVLSTIRTVQSNNVVTTVSVTNEDSAAGGSERQSLEQVKTNAPGALSALYRPMTKYDYNALIARLGGIQHVNVWGEMEEDPPSYDNMNWANVALVPTGGGQPSQNLLDTVKDYLLDHQPITVRVRFIPPEYIYFNIAVTAQVLPGYSQEDARIKITDEIRTFFELENVRFGQDVYASTFYKIAMGYDEVNNCSVADLVTYDADTDTETTVGQSVILQKWQVPVLNELTVTVSEAADLPVPDLYPDEDVDNVIWDYDDVIE